jgi:hypothetical protein
VTAFKNKDAMQTSPSRFQDALGKNHQAPPRLAVLTCPRCGHVTRMTAESFYIWTEGIRCGLCGPPDPIMRAKLTP